MLIVIILVQGSAQNARYQGICSWMVDPLAADPESRSHFLQCQPAPNNLFCGRWQRMPCAPTTVFNVESQVCVLDTCKPKLTNQFWIFQLDLLLCQHRLQQLRFQTTFQSITETSFRHCWTQIVIMADFKCAKAVFRLARVIQIFNVLVNQSVK